MPHDRTRYEWKNLLRLLVAMFGPGVFLFLKIVLSTAESRIGVTAGQIVWMNRASYGLLAMFFVTQFLAARYVQRLMPPARTKLRDAGQYVGVLFLCLFISYCGAAICEAFGVEFLIRFGAGARS